MKKIFNLIVFTVITALLLSSCGAEEEVPDRSYVESEVISAARSLIESSYELNTLLWGEGLLFSTDVSTGSGYYYQADYLSLEKYGVNTISDIEKKVREVFTEGYSNQIFSSTVFTSASDSDGNIVYFARYAQHTDADGKPICILIYSKWEPFLYDEVEYLYDTLKVSGVKGNTVFVNIDCNVTDKESGKTQKNTLEIRMIEEKDGWRIDSPTYSRYIDDILKK